MSEKDKDLADSAIYQINKERRGHQMGDCAGDKCPDWITRQVAIITDALTTVRKEAREAALKQLVDLDLIELLDDLEAARDYLSRGPWEVSEAAKQSFKVQIAEDKYECPEGSAQIRTTIDGEIPSRCLIPYGVIHYTDAEGIVLMRNRLEETIRVVGAAIEAAANTEEGVGDG